MTVCEYGHTEPLRTVRNGTRGFSTRCPVCHRMKQRARHHGVPLTALLDAEALAGSVVDPWDYSHPLADVRAAS